MAPITISTSLPTTSINHTEKILAVLHDHPAFIQLTCPNLISHTLDSGSSDPSSTATAIYSVTDKKPIGQTTYKLHLTNKPNGIETVVDAKAPVGGAMKISSRYVVSPGVLDEEIEIEANLVMKKMVKGNVEKNHPEQHKAILEKAGVATREAGGCW